MPWHVLSREVFYSFEAFRFSLLACCAWGSNILKEEDDVI